MVLFQAQLHAVGFQAPFSTAMTSNCFMKWGAIARAIRRGGSTPASLGTGETLLNGAEAAAKYMQIKSYGACEISGNCLV